MHLEGARRKKFPFTDDQILGILNRAEAGTPVPERCRDHGVSSATFPCFRKKNLVRHSESLGLEQMPGLARKQVNETRGHWEQCEKLAVDKRYYYLDVYSVCFEEFPETIDLWVETESRCRE
jgi:hypothetical protein